MSDGRLGDRCDLDIRQVRRDLEENRKIPVGFQPLTRFPEPAQQFLQGGSGLQPP